MPRLVTNNGIESLEDYNKRMNKMKLEVTEGCTAYSYEVDGEEWVDLTEEKCKEVLLKLIESCDDCQSLQHIFTTLVQDMGEYENLGGCDQCGDYVSRYTLEI